MKVITKNDGSLLSDSELQEVLSVLKDGGLIVYPTETLYGIGADALNELSVFRVFRAKKRPFDIPLSVAVSDLEMLQTIAYTDEITEMLCKKFLPGPLSILLPRKSVVPDVVSSGEDTMAIRIPDHPIALQIIREFGPLISTSANRHGGGNPTSPATAKDQLGEAIDIYIDAGPAPIGKPSTIIEVSKGGMNIVRYGYIPEEKIREAVDELLRGSE